MTRSGNKGGKGKKGSGLSPEDFHLWKEFTRDIEPLLPESYEEADQPPLPAEKISRAIPAPVRPQEPPPVRVKDAITSAQPPQLDARTELRLKRGQMPIEGRLDLHGHTQDQAHRMLSDFIISSQARGRRCVLVITGKGRSSAGRAEDESFRPLTGVLKEKLPLWLSMAPLRDIVLKTTAATPRDGGGGAFYLYLKRRREPSP